MKTAHAQKKKKTLNHTTSPIKHTASLFCFFMNLKVFTRYKKTKNTCSLPNHELIRYSQLTIALSSFNFLNAFNERKAFKKFGLAPPTTKELFSSRSYLLDSISQASLSTLIKHILLSHESINFRGMKKHKELDSNANANNVLI